MNNFERIHRMVRSPVSQDEAFALYDSLAPAPLSLMRGLWRGTEIQTGHPFEGLLTTAGWYGKRFVSPEEVYPLVMQRKNGRLYSISPTLIPLSLPLNRIPPRVAGAVFTLARPILATGRSAARLREVRYRGKLSAAMVYDTKGIIDVFRMVDAHKLMGIMDIKGLHTDKTYFFVLDRVQRSCRCRKTAR